MKQIPLCANDGHVRAYALVDDEDYTALADRPWSLQRNGYAVRHIDGHQQPMHRILLGLERGDPREGDHINRNRLDNRRANLRIATRAQNAQNLSAHPGRSRHRGVSWNTARQQWYASAKLNRKTHFLGAYNTETEAAQAAADFRAKHMPYSAEALEAA